MSRHLLPKPGTRARCVLDALLSFPTSPVCESALMARHTLNNQSPAKWLKEVYQTLQDAYLIECHGGGFNSSPRWALTDKGARLLRAEQAATAMAGSVGVGLEPAPSNIAPPRVARPFRPLAAGTVGMRVMREGALDYQNVPSLMGGRRCV